MTEYQTQWAVLEKTSRDPICMWRRQRHQSLQSKCFLCSNIMKQLYGLYSVSTVENNLNISNEKQLLSFTSWAHNEMTSKVLQATNWGRTAAFKSKAASSQRLHSNDLPLLYRRSRRSLDVWRRKRREMPRLCACGSVFHLACDLLRPS